MSADKPNLQSTDGTADDSQVNTSYKEQLDEAARKAKNPGPKTSAESPYGPSAVEKVVETVSQYVPVVGKVLGKDDKDGKEGETSEKKGDPKIPGPPDRPDHDTQIEEFVRDQHRSKEGDGLEGE